MREKVLIEGNSPREFVDACNEIYAELSRASIVSEHYLSATAMYLTYDTPDETDAAAETIYNPDCEGRYCSECQNYEWGKRCLAGVPGVRPMTEACGYFNVELGGVRQ